MKSSNIVSETFAQLFVFTLRKICWEWGSKILNYYTIVWGENQGSDDFLVKSRMLFYSFFKSLVGKDVVVELKNDLSICGTLHSVDQYLNIKLTDISVTDPDKHPHMSSVKSSFIRGSVVRYVQLPADEVDTQLLQDATRKEFVQNK